MALPTRSSRVLRSVRGAFPSRTLAGRLSEGAGPAEFIPLDEVLSAQLDEFFPSAAQGSIIYRGASAWEVLGPGTATQVLTTNGAGADPSWENPATGGGLFLPPLAADFPTTMNEVTSTITATDDADRGLVLSLASTAGSIRYSARLKSYSVPGSGTDTFIWAAKYTATVNTNSNPCAGFVIADGSGTGADRLFFGFGRGPSSPVFYLSRQTTGSTTVGTDVDDALNEDEQWFKCEIDSTGAIRFYRSADGAVWHLFRSTTVATHLGTVTHIGFILGGISGTTGNMSVFYYEES